MPADKTTLYAKLAEVTAEVGYVAKDGKNDFQNYRYTSAEALLAAIRGPLSTRKVALMPSLAGISEREYTTSKGKASIITTATVKFTFVDGETGEKHECEWAGQGDDPADKGLGKAFTNAIKTFLREQFLIPQGDDPEADRGADERGADRAPRNAPNRSPAPRQAQAHSNFGTGELVTAEDIRALRAAASGLSVAQIKQAFVECGLPRPDGPPQTLFTRVPREKAKLLAEAFTAVPAPELS